MIAEVLEKLNDKRCEKTYREDLLPISKNDVFLVFRDLFITVINRSPFGRRAVPSQGTVCCSPQALSVVPSAPSPKLSDPQALVFLLPSFKGNQTTMGHSLQGSVSYCWVRTHGNKGSEDCRGRKPELAGSPGLRGKRLDMH